MPTKIPLLIISLFASFLAFADDIKQLAPTVVTATRVETNSFDLPVSIDVVQKKDISNGQLGLQLSESLIRVPGISSQSRNQLAQDTQISSRGFGARSAFGVRGLRLYVDGIPLTMPDGIGQPLNVDLNNIKSIEIMRGPFSSLYGSSSGGVIQLRTDDAPKNLELSTDFKVGSFGTTKESMKATGTSNGIEYLFDVGVFNTEGYRDQSAAHRKTGTALVKFNLENDTRVSILANHSDLNAQDPLGSPRYRSDNSSTYRNTNFASGYDVEPSAFSNPTDVPSMAKLVNSSVHKENTQIGISLEHKINENNSINFINSVGHRINSQILPVGLTSNTSRNSVITRNFFSNELNWTLNTQFLGKNLQLVSGLFYGSMRDKRADLNGKYGITAYRGTSTIVNRLEKNLVSNLDEFVQARWQASDKIDIHAGIRNTNVNFEIQDQKANNTGGRHFSRTTYVSGLTYKLNSSANIYLNYGKGFETPTLVEMAYTNGGNDGSGPNLTISPSTSENYEFGTKFFINNTSNVNLAFFRTNTTNEIVVKQGGTYTAYWNAGQTVREGIEASFDSRLNNNLDLYLAYTFLDARFASIFSNGTIINNQNVIPGTYRTQLYGELAYRYPSLGFTTALETRYNSKVFVNDVNSDYAPAYTIVNLRAGFEQNLSNWKINEYARIENLFDKDYIGSVRINDSNSRFFEAAPGINALAGISATYKF